MFQPDSDEFVTDWRVERMPCDVVSVLKDVEAFPRWWRPVYISVTILEPGEPDGVRRILELTTRDFLPYLLRWQIRVVESVPGRITARRQGGVLARAPGASPRC